MKKFLKKSLLPCPQVSSFLRSRSQFTANHRALPGYKETVMTEEVLQKKALKSQRRREVAAQKRETEKVFIPASVLLSVLTLLSLRNGRSTGFCRRKRAN